jgi:cobalt-zinc-cadmium resistance protein CzcA
MFSPLAWTLGFALLGALIFALILVPVMASILLKKNVKEKYNQFLSFVTKQSVSFFDQCYRNKRLSLIIAGTIMIISLITFRYLGTEFLPQLNEGALWMRATLPYSISLNESVKIADEMRRIIRSFPEVKQVVSQTGRPDDGTDVTGFYNNEFLIDLYHTKRMEHKKFRDELIDSMFTKLQKFPGVIYNFSQPIMDNVEEAVSGVKGSIVTKIFGEDLFYLDNKADSIIPIMKKVRGIDDLGIIQSQGQPEFRIELNQEKMAWYGVNTADCNAVIEMAIGGKAASTFYEGYKKFDIRIRFLPEFRMTEKEVGNLMVPTISGGQIPIKEIAEIKKVTGPILIFRDNNERYVAVKFSVRGRDMGSTIAEAQKKVNSSIKLPKGYRMAWQGDFENQQRASARLRLVVPISLMLIFFILFVLFGNVRDSGLILLNVPFAIIGGVFALYITGTNFGISAGIGFIALFGICIQNNVILLSKFKKNLHDRLQLDEAIRSGVIARIRPVIMTALMAAIGLMPAATSIGIGSETSRPLAIVVIGGLITATVLTLFIFPIIFKGVYSLKQRKIGL